MSLKARLFWIVFVLSVAIDQGTKLWISATMPEGRDHAISVVPGFFDVIHAENPGAAFSLFRDFGYRVPMFLVFTAVAVWVVWDQFKRIDATSRWMPAALGLIASGAVGNAIDRLHKGTVTDFIRIYTENPSIAAFLRSTPLHSNEWPTFNVADSALLVGVLLFVLAGWKADRKDEAAAPTEAPRAAAGE